MIRFYDNTLETRFIKYLLANTYTPLLGIAEKNNYIREGFSYVTKDSLIQLKGEEEKELLYGGPYAPIFSYKNVTTSYLSNSEGYDPVTHYYLGQYLRMLRDIYDINLMSLYNCIDGKWARSVDIDEKGSYTVVDSSGFKVLLVPIKWNQKYSIFYPGDTLLSIRPVIYASKGLINSFTSFNEKGIAQTIDFVDRPNFNSAFARISNCWQEPYIYTSPTPLKTSDTERNTVTDTFAQVQLERYLKLAIKIPENLDTSLVVLEGDYSHQNRAATRWHDGHPPIVGKVMPYACGNIGLTERSDGYIHPFSDKLIEYLSLNAITSLEEIDANVARVQQQASSGKMADYYGMRYKELYKRGVWDETLQIYIYNLQSLVSGGRSNIQANRSVLLDALGFVDKDIEPYLVRGGSR